MSRLVLPLLLISACAKKPTETSPASEPAKPEITAEMPDSKEARKFAQRLIAYTLTEWSPTNDKAFMWDAVSFSADGNFTAQAALVASGERIACDEIGHWRIDKGVSTSTATMDWDIIKTDCPSREAPATLRVSFTFAENGTVKIAHR
jgi:hypothetical protein